MRTVPVADLRAVILLAGQLGRNPFADGIGRSLLDLPDGGDGTFHDRWMAQLDGLAAALGLDHLLVRVCVDRNGTPPRLGASARAPRVEVEVVRDPAEYRGTAGLVRDLVGDYGDDDRVLVAAAHQIQREPVADVVRDLARRDEGVTIVPHLGSEIAGMFLLRCGRLREVPDIGFVDLKEQALPSSSGRSPLFVSRREAGSMLPVRTLDEYVHALRVVRASAGPDAPDEDDPYAETWRPVFSIVEPGATVAPGAVLQDSVVLAGGRVEEGAVVARSVVCSGGVAPAGACIVEAMVTA